MAAAVTNTKEDILFLTSHNLNSATGNVNNPDNPLLAFLHSTKVHAYPCGRRKSTLIKGKTDTDYHVPFDPEARLSTEYNNRKHSGVNGLVTSFFNEFNVSTRRFSMVLDGYYFDIELPNTKKAQDTVNSTESFVEYFVEELEKELGAAPGLTIYANIRLEETPLFKGDVNYNTWILRNQTATKTADSTLDIKIPGTIDNNNVEQYYYFSGLSFSYYPATRILDEDLSSITILPEDTDHRKQEVISLCILKRNSTSKNDWRINEAAKLPRLKHGDAEGSVRFERVEANHFYYIENTPNGTVFKKLAVIDLLDQTHNPPRLRFSHVNIESQPED